MPHAQEQHKYQTDSVLKLRICLNSYLGTDRMIVSFFQKFPGYISFPFSKYQVPKQDYFLCNKIGYLFFFIFRFLLSWRNVSGNFTVFSNNRQLIGSCSYSLGICFWEGHHHNGIPQYTRIMEWNQNSNNLTNTGAVPFLPVINLKPEVVQVVEAPQPREELERTWK